MKLQHTTAALIGLALSNQGLAHGFWQPSEGASLKMEVMSSFRTEGNADDRVWQVPGALMGGDANGNEEGFALNYAGLNFGYGYLNGPGQSQLFGIAELASHDEHDPEFEKAYLGIAKQWDAYQVRAEMGKLTAEFSPLHSSHPVDQLFTDRPLAYDLIYGGQYHDNGLRVLLAHAEGRGIGLEAFNGGSFPADAENEPGAFNAYAYYHWVFDSSLLQARIWHSRFDADLRSDERFDESSSHGHSHSIDSDSPFANYTFDGDVKATGFRLKFIAMHFAPLRIEATIEHVRAEQEGDIRLSPQLSGIDSELNASYAELAFYQDRHTLAFSLDQIETDNRFSGDAGPAIAESLELEDMGRNPSRVRMAYQYQWHDALSIGTEWLRDLSTEDEFDAVLLTARWQTDWL